MINLQKTTELFIIICLIKSLNYNLKEKIRGSINKFFSINNKLPIELNMRIANLVYKSNKIFIKQKTIDDIYDGYLKEELNIL